MSSLPAEVIKHFSDTDQVMSDLLTNATELHTLTASPPHTYFHRLTQDIIGQQLSVKVAAVIGQRFVALFLNQTPTPEQILDIDEQTLRSAGMSWAKIRSVKDLSLHVLEKKLPFAHYPDWSDEQIIENLIQVKGIGRWTAEMFLIFTMGREDVFSLGDLGLKRAIEKNYMLAKDSDPKTYLHLIESWAPYRTYSSLALWNSLDNIPK